MDRVGLVACHQAREASKIDKGKGKGRGRISVVLLLFDCSRGGRRKRRSITKGARWMEQSESN